MKQADKAPETKKDPNVDKKALRFKQLQDSYEVIRSKTSTCAILVRLNYVEPPLPIVTDPVVVIDPKAKVAPAKKK